MSQIPTLWTYITIIKTIIYISNIIININITTIVLIL